MKNKITLSLSIVFIFALIFLLFNAGKNQVSKVVTVSQIQLQLKENDQIHLSNIRLAGKVVDKKIDYQVEPNIVLSFFVSDPGKKTSIKNVTNTNNYGKKYSNKKTKIASNIQVIYNGVKPDMFSVGRDIIADGELRNGVFYADKLLTQCPSKYEAPKPTEAQIL